MALTLKQKQAIAIAKAKQKLASEDESWADVGRQALGQGTLLGFGDEILGTMRGIGSGLTSDESFGDAISAGIDKERAINEGYEERNLGKSLAYQLAGGLLTGGAGMARVGALKGAGMLAKMGRGAGVGATQGGVAGVGYGEGNVLTGEGAMERALSGALGATLGGGLGAALPVAGAAITNFPVLSTSLKSRSIPFRQQYQQYKRDVKESKLDKEIDEAFGRGLGDEHVTAEQLDRGARELSEAVGEDIATAVDSSVARLNAMGGGRGSDLSRLKDMAERAISDQTDTAIPVQLAQRNAQQGTRVNRHIDRNVSNKAAHRAGDNIGEIDRLSIKRQVEAEKMYGSAYNKEIIPGEELKAILKDGLALKAANHYARNMYDLLPPEAKKGGFREQLSTQTDELGEKYAGYGEGAREEVMRILDAAAAAKDKLGPITPRQLEHIKWGLDKQISKLREAPGDNEKEIYALVRFKDRYVAALDNSKGAELLRDARAAYKTTSGQIEDIERGISLIARKPIQNQVSELKALRLKDKRSDKGELIDKTTEELTEDAAKLERLRIGAAYALKEKAANAAKNHANTTPNQADRNTLELLFPEDLASNASNLFKALDAEDILWEVGEAAVKKTGRVPLQKGKTIADELASAQTAALGAAAVGGSTYSKASLIAKAYKALRPSVAEKDMRLAEKAASRLYRPVASPPPGQSILLPERAPIGPQDRLSRMASALLNDPRVQFARKGLPGAVGQQGYNVLN